MANVSEVGRACCFHIVGKKEKCANENSTENA